MQKTAFLVLIGLAGTGLTGCSQLMTDNTPEPVQPKQVATVEVSGTQEEVRYADFEPDILYLLLAAEVGAQRGRYDVTLANYVKAAKRSQDKGVISRAMRIAQSLNGDNAQQQLADLWLKQNPESLEAHRVSAIQAVKRGDLEVALEHMETILDLGGDADFDSLAAMAASMPEPSQIELLDLYHQLEQRHPGNHEIQYSIALLQKVTSRYEAALSQLEPILADKPEFQPALVLRGDLLYQLGRKEEALQFLRYNSRRYPENRQLGTLFGRMLISEGRLQAAQDEFKRLTDRFPNAPGLRLSHALVALENDETELARTTLVQLIEQGHHTNEAHYYLGRIADEEGDTETAAEYYELVSGGSHFFPALTRLSNLQAQAGNLDQALANIRNLRAENPGQAETFWLLELNLLQDQKRTEEALEAATEALKTYPGNTRIRYSRSMLLDSMDRTDDAEAELRKILETEPDNSVALNALGYILTIKTDRYDEARILIERALELDPDNPAILDSMGWVLYKQGQLEESLKYLRSAYETLPDPEVAAHLGEVLWQNDNREQARLIWQEGLKANPEDTLIIETIERLGLEPVPDD